MNILKIPLTNIYYFDIIIIGSVRDFHKFNIYKSKSARESILALYKYLAVFCFGGNMQEVWKDVKGFEKFYQISNFGNVRSKDRYKRNNKGESLLKGKILKLHPNSKGYLRIMLNDGQVQKYYFIHRLVALHFVDNLNPEINTVVNHLDNNFLNNKADNLEWTTLKGNAQHALKQGRTIRTKEWLENLHKSLEKYCKPVIGYEPLSGKSVVSFNSIQECKRNGYDASCVCDCCKGKRKTHKGLMWKYANTQ